VKASCPSTVFVRRRLVAQIRIKELLALVRSREAVPLRSGLTAGEDIAWILGADWSLNLNARVSFNYIGRSVDKGGGVITETGSGGPLALSCGWTVEEVYLLGCRCHSSY